MAHSLSNIVLNSKCILVKPEAKLRKRAKINFENLIDSLKWEKIIDDIVNKPSKG